jgi:hypothetical protein
MGRYNDAIVAWNRALSGDGDSIDRSDIDKKIGPRVELPRMKLAPIYWRRRSDRLLRVTPKLPSVPVSGARRRRGAHPGAFNLSAYPHRQRRVERPRPIGSQGMRGRLLAGLVAPAVRISKRPRRSDPHLHLLGERRRCDLAAARSARARARPPADVFRGDCRVPLGPADLRATLTGCADAGDRRTPSASAMRGVIWTAIFICIAAGHRSWRLVAVVHRAGRTWRADYSDF